MRLQSRTTQRCVPTSGSGGASASAGGSGPCITTVFASRASADGRLGGTERVSDRDDARAGARREGPLATDLRLRRQRRVRQAEGAFGAASTRREMRTRALRDVPSIGSPSRSSMVDHASSRVRRSLEDVRPRSSDPHQSNNCGKDGIGSKARVSRCAASSLSSAHDARVSPASTIDTRSIESSPQPSTHVQVRVSLTLQARSIGASGVSSSLSLS